MNKKLEKFAQNHKAQKGKELASLLISLGFELKNIRGSHQKYVYENEFVLLAIHNNDCKNYQKKHAQKVLKKLNFIQ